MKWLAESPQRARLLTITASLLIGVLLMGVKFYAYWLTQSAAILSDALESIINVVASAFALGAVVLAAKPPDTSHPYGHGKIEYFSVGFEGALIFLAAVGIFIKAVDQLRHPRALPSLEIGLGLLLGASLVNLGLGTGSDLCRQENQFHYPGGRWPAYPHGCFHLCRGLNRLVPGVADR